MATKTKAGRGASKQQAGRAKVKWPFPRATLEKAIEIPYAVKQHNGGNPWEPDEVRKAIGVVGRGNA